MPQNIIGLVSKEMDGCVASGNYQVLNRSYSVFMVFIPSSFTTLAKGKLEFNGRARKSQVPPLQSLINICGNFAARKHKLSRVQSICRIPLVG